MPQHIMSYQKKRIVVCAAIRTEDGLIICSARHWDRLMGSVAREIGIERCRTAEQGFIDQFGNFLTREEARELVLTTGQLSEDQVDHHRMLFSEDLY